MSTQTSSPPATGDEPAALENFFEHVRLTNPFLINRVVQPSTPGADADHVHHAAFTQLVNLAQKARDQQLGIGVVLWGEAGVGKSHLLARLARWADRDRQGCFLYLQNLQASPENLPRSLLKAAVSILTRGRSSRLHETPLFRLVNAGIKAALGDGGASAPSFEVAEHAYHNLVDRLSARDPSRAALVDRQVYGVLFRFFRSAYLANKEQDDPTIAALALRWLSGDYLDPDEARQLDLPPLGRRDEPVALADDQQVKLVLIALSQLALFRHHLFVLCFDQVDNLEPEQFKALSRFVQALLDSAPDLLVVTCGVHQALLKWHQEGVIQESTWDRIAQFEINLLPVTPPEARQIVQARLEQFLEPFVELAAVKDWIHKDHLFPLGLPWCEETLKGRDEVRPRSMINWAREAWSRQQQQLALVGGPRWLAEWPSQRSEPEALTLSEEEIQHRVDEKIERKLGEHQEQRRLDPENLPADADNQSGLVYTLLAQCGDDSLEVQRLQALKYKPRPAYDLIVQQRGGGADKRTGIVFIATGSAFTVTGYLRRLAQDANPPGRVLLISDERLPLKLGPKGRDYLQQLRRRGDRFRERVLTFTEYAALDALKAVVGMARSGDLEIDLPQGQSRRVSEEEALESHRRRDRYRRRALLGELLAQEPPRQPASAPPPAPGEPTPLEEKELREFIMARLALTMGASTHELVAWYVHDRKVRRQSPLDEALCRRGLEDVARNMHAAGLIQATPHDDGLYLLLR